MQRTLAFFLEIIIIYIELIKKISWGVYKITGSFEPNLNIVPAEFEDFPTVANGAYDIVLLSNVKDYVTRWKGDDLFYRVAAKLYKKNLNPGGVMELQTSVSFFHDIKDTELVRFANKLNAKKRKLLNAGLFGQTDVFLIEKPKIMEMQETM